MVKKINSDEITIKALLNEGIRPNKISRLLHISKQKINYLKKTPIKTTQIRRKKLSEVYIKKICELAEISLQVKYLLEK